MNLYLTEKQRTPPSPIPAHNKLNLAEASWVQGSSEVSLGGPGRSRHPRGQEGPPAVPQGCCSPSPCPWVRLTLRAGHGDRKTGLGWGRARHEDKRWGPVGGVCQGPGQRPRTEGHSTRLPPGLGRAELSHFSFLSISVGGGCLPVPTAEEPTRCLLRHFTGLVSTQQSHDTSGPRSHPVSPPSAVSHVCTVSNAHPAQQTPLAVCSTVQSCPAGSIREAHMWL